MRQNGRLKNTENGTLYAFLSDFRFFISVYRYPLLLDAIIQSRGAGFVGTEYSTMTTVALRRVQDWSQGAVRVTHWGWPGADDH